jgi:lipopolysaccharide export system protein LptA
MGVLARRWLRHGTAALIILAVAAMAMIAGQRIRQIKRPVAEVDADQMRGPSDDPVEGVYRGQRYVETIAGQLVFVLNSVRTLGKTSGWHEIEGVRLQLYNEGTEGPLLTCEAARFNIETRDAALRGPVTVEFPGGAILNTESARFRAQSRELTAESKVLFTDGESIGQAGRAVYSLVDDRLDLIDDAIMRSGDGVSLRAPRIVYMRDKRLIEFPEGCLIERNGSEVSSATALIELTDDEGSPRRVVFSDGVVAHASSGQNGGHIEGRAERVVAERDPNGNWQLEATTSGSWITVLMRGSTGFFERNLETMLLRGVIAPEGVLNLRAERGVCLSEIPVEGDPRRAEAQTVRVWFSDGDPSDMELSDQVVIQGEGIEAKGHRARVSTGTGMTMLHGNPFGPERAILISDRGRISCDHAQMFDRDGRTEARGNVQGRFEEVVLLGTESDTERAPLHFAAEVLEVSESGATLRLRENARLWQGHRLVLADDVVYHQVDEVLDASGHVRTTLPALQIDPLARPGDDVVVVARSLHFDRSQQQATYTGNVRYSDPGHMLSANELSVFFDSENTITTVEAVGKVELVDLATGRRMTGQKARREIATQTVHVTGTPVQLTDQSGTVISSSSLTWDQASGSVTVAGGTETIYYPEDTP